VIRRSRVSSPRTDTPTPFAPRRPRKACSPRSDTPRPVRPEEAAKRPSRRACGCGGVVAGGSSGSRCHFDRAPRASVAPHHERHNDFAYGGLGASSPRTVWGWCVVRVVRDGPSRRLWRPRGLLTTNGLGVVRGSGGSRPPLAPPVAASRPPHHERFGGGAWFGWFETAPRAACGGLGASSPRTVWGVVRGSRRPFDCAPRASVAPRHERFRRFRSP
jgi:hypothetical protein